MARIFSGSGDPNGAVFADPGDVYQNETGGPSTAFWVKESGFGDNLGWVALTPTFLPDITDNPGVEVEITVPTNIVGALSIEVADPTVGASVFKPNTANEDFQIVKQSAGGIVMFMGQQLDGGFMPAVSIGAGGGLTGSQDNYLLNGSGIPDRFMFFTPSPAPLTFTGFDAEAGQTFLAQFGSSYVPYFHLINKSSTDPITIAHDSLLSLTKHRVLCPGAVDFVIPARGAAGFIRNTPGAYAGARWQLFSAAGLA